MNGSNNIEFITNVNPTNVGTDTKLIYQFLYASQLYGTLFGVYGRFEINEGYKPSDTSYEIKGIFLKIVNYQGLLNIGFTPHNCFFSPAKENGDNKDKIFFAVRGASGIRDKHYKLPSPITITKGMAHRLLFSRILYPLADFEFNANQREDYGTQNPITAPIPEGDYFDTEFEHRNGIDHFYKSLKPGMTEYDKISIENLENGTAPLVSARCHEGDVDIFS